jgi:hypothetical protein
VILRIFSPPLQSFAPWPLRSFLAFDTPLLRSKLWHVLQSLKYALPKFLFLHILRIPKLCLFALLPTQRKNTWAALFAHTEIKTTATATTNKKKEE